MSKIDDGGPAFPCEGGGQSGLHAAPGMTLREWFAGQTLSGLVSRADGGYSSYSLGDPEDVALLAQRAVQIADALLRELKGGAT